MKKNYNTLLDKSTEIKVSLSKNKIENAIEGLIYLTALIDDEKFKKNAILISANYYKQLDKRIRGTLERFDFSENNKLNESILDLVSLIEKFLVKKSSEENQIKEKITGIYESKLKKNSKNLEQNNQISNSVINLILNKSSIYGIIILYSVKMCYSKKISINLKKVSNIVNGNLEYFEGFLNPLIALNLLKITKVKDGSSQIRVDYLDERIDNQIESSLNAILKKFSTNEKHRFVKEEIEKLNKYFSNR